MNKKKTRLLSKTICTILAVMMILLSSACGGSSGTVSLNFAKDEQKVISPEAVNQSLHLTDNQKLKFIATSGLISLYIDTQSFGIAVTERSQNKTWYALPENENDGYDFSASVVNMSVVDGETEYNMNSQDNSVDYKTANYESDKESLTVKYIIAPNEETATKTEFKAEDIAFGVYVKYTLKDGNLFVSTDWDNLSGNPNAKIKDLGILEFFGASDTAVEGDYILVPDGCGALINTAVEDKSFEPMEFTVYGEDCSNETNGNAVARLAAYGAKQGNSAFAVIVQSGDAVATIHADRATGESSFNKVGARFSITSVYDENKSETKTTRYIGGEGYTGEIKMCYRFFNGSNANYSGMAIACREQLIRDKVLTVKPVKQGDYLPMNLTLVGAVKEPIFGFTDVLKKTTALTTFDQAQDLLMQIKAKGINNINLRYIGALSGGINQSNIFRANIIRKLDGADGFQQLCDYMSAQNLSLFIDVNILSTSKSYSFGQAATNIKGDKSNYFYDFGLNDYLDVQGADRELLSPSKLEKSVNSILSKFSEHKIAGFCVNDAGSKLYSDYSGEFIDRSETADIISRQIATVSMSKELMINYGNIRTVKNANVIVNIPILTQKEESKAYSAVPFLQMILHGIVNYSGEAINLSQDVQASMLRSIEFGACPSYKWVYEELDVDGEEHEKYFYGDWLTQAVSFYERANEALSDLTGSRMTKHEKIADGVYSTEYNDSSLVYVNYNDESVKVGELTVGANGFLRIN